MKIALIGDTHLGYPRFEQDSYNQAKAALEDAEQKADLIIIAGDVFDTKIPRMEVIEKAISLFKKIKKPIITIHGNHERRSKDMVNILKLLDSGGVIDYLHNESKVLEIDEEKVNIIGLGNIPAGYVKEALENIVKNNPKKEGIFNILITHQDINELSIGDELYLQDLEELPFELIINGHIHKHQVKLNGKLIVPGSTVVTQLKEEEKANRGYVIYDIKEKKHEFVEIPCREFKYISLEFKEAGINEINEKIKEIIGGVSEEQIVKIVLKGTIKQGIKPNELSLPSKKNIFLDNKLNAKTLKNKLDEIKRSKEKKMSVREFAVKEIEEKAKGKVIFDPSILFEKLSKGTDEAERYLLEIELQKEKQIKK